MEVLIQDLIKKISSDKRLIPDLMKSENGNNFRAISESAILDVIDPILKETGWFYTVSVRDKTLDIREAYGSKGKKLQFIATVTVRLTFYNSYVNFEQEAVGMGIDDNDKAMGKAYTYAVKYALLKKFRITYSDDPDATESYPIETNSEGEEKGSKKGGRKKTKEEELLITEKMSGYIIGLVKKLDISDEKFKKKYGYYPSSDKIPMDLARKIIDKLKMQEDDLPF